MKAELIQRNKSVLSDGAILEVVIWRVPKPVEGCVHSYKYSLFYGYKGQRIVGYDNERLKGDHRHLDNKEEPYHFTTPEALIRDFLSDVQRRRAK